MMFLPVMGHNKLNTRSLRNYPKWNLICQPSGLYWSWTARTRHWNGTVPYSSTARSRAGKLHFIFVNSFVNQNNLVPGSFGPLPETEAS